MAGARAEPDTAFVAHAKSTCDIYLAENGVDSGDGRDPSRAWATLRFAVPHLTKGMVACLAPGDYNDAEAVTAASGDADEPIVIRGTPGATRLHLDATKSALWFNHAYWIAEGLDFDLAHRAVSGVVIAAAANHVVFRNSRVHDGAGGAGVYVAGDDVACGTAASASTSATTTAPWPDTESVVIRRNVFFDLNTGDKCGNAIFTQRVQHVDIHHNTIDRIPGSAVSFGTSNESPESKIGDFDVFDNIIRDAGRFVDLNTTTVSSFSSDRNIFYATTGSQDRFRLNGSSRSLAAWQSAGHDPNSRVIDPEFVSGAGTTDDYYTEPGSPARGAASDGTDIGFRQTW